jgi:hypothetical protein
MTTDTLKLSDELEAQIRDALAPLHPEKVILLRYWGRTPFLARRRREEAVQVRERVCPFRHREPLLRTRRRQTA